MAHNLIITTKASSEALKTCNFYDIRQIGLSERFLADLTKTYKKITENPEHYSFISSRKKHKLRDVKLEDFPYLVIFNIQNNDVIVHSVFNTSRKPKYK